MRRKLVIICMAACMLCLAIGCGTGKDNNVADESTSATNNNSSAELKKTDAVSEPVAKQEVEKQNDSNLEVDEGYKNLPESEGFVFESNGDGTCDLKEIGLCKDTDIVIPEKSPEGDVVTKIDEYAFYDAEDIASIIFAGRNMEIADNAGIVKLLSKGLRPVVLWLFPGLRREKGEKAVEYITLNFIMNMLGTGWSATGPGLMAMEELNRLKCSDSQINVDTASDEMCTFLVMNISSLQLIPVNIIAYRRAYGSVEPAKIVIPALIATSISTVAAVIFCKIMCKCRSA